MTPTNNAKPTTTTASDDSSASPLTIKTSKTGLPIPVVNGVHLHSIYDPTREAQLFASSHAETLKNNREILCLGLGFMFHIHEICNTLSQHHQNNYKVIVIEPVSEVYNECRRMGLANNENVIIYHGQKVEELYKRKPLINFLLSKPAVISHAPSFNLHKKYFQDLLTYKAPTDMLHITEHINDPALKNYLLAHGSHITISETVETLLFNGTKEDYSNDFLIAAFSTIGERKAQSQDTML